jgi:signal transduction histidine kinase
VRVLVLESHENERGPGKLTLEVKDWGSGFVPEQKIGEEGRVGLQGIIERASLLGANHSIQSAPGSGTTVRAEFPVLEPHPEE